MTEDAAPAILDAIIVGSGFAGLCMAIRCQQAGHRTVMLEQADRLGGTWRDNHYPGAACDVPSSLYCFSFAPNPDWSQVYAAQAEIEAYMNRCADTFDVRRQLRLNHRVVAARFLKDSLIWEVEAECAGRMLTFLGRSLILGTGGLSRPKLPDIEGLAAFGGKLCHTARWDDRFDASGLRVGVIGTGASAIQLVPLLAQRAAKLVVFQRTPAWIVPKEDAAVSAAQRDAYRRQPWRQRLRRALTYALLESRAIAFTRAPGLLKLAQRRVQRYLAMQVPDASLRVKLTPDYVMGCKRILLSNDFYPALMRDNVELVTNPIERVTANGIVTKDGREHALDVIVAATGFHAAEAGAPFVVSGVDGRDLNTVWRDGARAYLGTTVSGFPNLFVMTGPNTGLGHNSMIYMIESQTSYILDALGRLRDRGGALDVRSEVQERYNTGLQNALATTVWNAGGCQSWYLTRSGFNSTLWPDFTFVFRRRTRRFDAGNYRWLQGDDR